jgi:transcriptional regulator with XRE-family HTH domain
MADEIDRTWGVRIRAHRQARGLSLMQLGAACDLDKAHLSRIELGQLVPSTEIRVRIAKALEVDPNELFSYPSAERAASAS